MNIRPALLLSLACLTACAVAQPELVDPNVDRDMLLSDLRVLSADDMEGRLLGSAGNEKARAYVVERFEASGIEPFGTSFEQPFAFTSEGRDGRREHAGVNVVGRIGGRANPDRAIVVTAHYDHVGAPGGVVYNGADDNASGTAALFAVGRHFARQAPAHSIILAALDGEEGGLRGARAFIAAPPVPLDAMALNVNLDMIGRDPDDRLFAVGTYHYPFLKPFIEQVAARAPVTLLVGHDEPGKPDVEDWTRDSDHFVFHQRDIPFIYFGVEDFGQHHQATDDYETITHDFYARAVETVISAIAVFDANLEAISRARPPR